MLELNRLEIMLGCLELVKADLEGKGSDFSAHLTSLVIQTLQQEITQLEGEL